DAGLRLGDRLRRLPRHLPRRLPGREQPLVRARLPVLLARDPRRRGTLLRRADLRARRERLRPAQHALPAPLPPLPPCPERHRPGSEQLLDTYSEICLARVWQATRFSYDMTKMLHAQPDGDAFENRLQLTRLRRIAASRHAAAELAANYTGLPLMT